MATPDIHLLAIENWTKLADSVDYTFMTTTLNSSTSYTVSDSHVGSELECRRDGIHDRRLRRLERARDRHDHQIHVFAGWEAVRYGQPLFASGFGIPANARELSCHETFSPLFNLWFNIPTIVSGTGPIVEGT